VTDDLRSAQVYFGVLDRTARRRGRKGSAEGRARIHHLLGKAHETKHIPRLTFHSTANLDYGIQISKYPLRPGGKPGRQPEDSREDNRKTTRKTTRKTRGGDLGHPRTGRDVAGAGSRGSSWWTRRWG